MEGEKVDLSIKMYFGEVELRVEGKYHSVSILYPCNNRFIIPNTSYNS